MEAMFCKCYLRKEVVTGLVRIQLCCVECCLSIQCDSEVSSVLTSGLQTQTYLTLPWLTAASSVVDQPINQCPNGVLQCLGGNGDSGTAARALLQASCPMFEAFWQGRLIPGARIDSLPFVEVSRCWVALTMHHARSTEALFQGSIARLRLSACMHASFPGISPVTDDPTGCVPCIYEQLALLDGWPCEKSNART